MLNENTLCILQNDLVRKAYNNNKIALQLMFQIIQFTFDTVMLIGTNIM